MSRAWLWLLRKEWRELVASRAWWVMLAAIGPLVGVSFIDAATTYAEASGLHGTAAGVGEAFSPLIGIWAPTFSACELAAAFLLPFVAIRVVSGDAQSGALKIEAQHRLPALARVGAKAVVLLAGWLIASLAPAITVVLWMTYGGSVYAPELASVVAGHVLNAMLTIGLAAAAAAMTEHPSTAAIVTLAVTVGTWVINFIAAVHGGIWQRAAGYTPTAMVAEFQHGLIRLDVVLVASALAAAGLGAAAIWLRIGVAVRRRVRESLALAAAAAAIVAACAFVHASWDVSESRMNSFPEGDEATLALLGQPLRIEVHLAPEDPRRSDLESRALKKLRRALPDVTVDYMSQSTIGLFEQTREHYGEIWYELGGKKTMSRATTSEGVLEAIYEVAGVAAPGESDDDVFRGHPLPVAPTGAAAVFYVAWPVAVVAAGVFVNRRR